MAVKIVDYTKQGSSLGKGKLGDVKGLVVHHTGTSGSVDSVISGLQKRGYGIQFVMDRDGTVYQLLPDGAKTSHVKGLNSNYVGIEVIAKDDGDITQQQSDAIYGFATQELAKYGLKPSPQTILGHMDLPGQSKRKSEGQTLKWVALSQAGFDPPADAKLFGDDGKGNPAKTWAQLDGGIRRPLVGIPQSDFANMALAYGSGGTLTTQPLAYSVQKGDTLTSIAKRLGTDAQTLASINGITDPNKLKIGQTLRGAAPPEPLQSQTAPADGSIPSAYDSPKTLEQVAELYRGIIPQQSGPTAQPGMMGRNVSPALAAARERLTAARAASGATSPGAMSVTPNINGTGNQPLPSSAQVDARRSLFSNQPIAETGLAGDTMNRGGSFAPLTLPNLPDGMLTAPNPAPYAPTMPTGGPGTFAVASNAARGAAVTEAAPVPLPRDARPASQAAPSTAAAAKQYTTINGKQFEVGSLHKLGNDTWKVVIGPDGKGKTEKVNIDILDEATKNTMAGGIVRDVWGNAVSGAKESVTAAVAPALSDVGTKASELAGQAGSFLSNLFGGKPANANTPTTVTNPVKPEALSGGRSIEARDEASSGGSSLTPYSNSAWGASLVPAPKATVTSTGAGLAAPGAGLTAAQKNAMTTVTKYREVVNPAYTAFMAASGSGTQGLSPDERDEAQRSKLMGGLAATGIAAKAPPQFIRQAYTVEVPVSSGPALTPSRSVAAPIVQQPKIYSSGGYLFVSDGKGGTKNIGRDATFANREAGSRGTAAGSSGSYSDRLETTAVQRANYDRQGIAY